MAKYIDADRLRARIEKYLTFDNSIDTAFYIGRRDAERSILDLIDSLQQEQDLIVINKKDWEMQEQFRKNKVFGKSLQQEQPESSKGKFLFPNFLYARTVDNKTIDVSYAPQSLDAVEYIKNDPTEQPEVDLEKEIERWWGEKYMKNSEGLPILPVVQGIARHFAEWQSKQDKETIELAEDHAYLAGAVNEREKMMKEAVETTITTNLAARPIIYLDDIERLGFKYGDKVRIIVLPKWDSHE